MPASLTVSLKNTWKRWVGAGDLSRDPTTQTPSETQVSKGAPKTSTKNRGDAAEALALAHLQSHGLRLLARNYKTPGRGGGEVDLIMQHGDTLVFAEVRQRKTAAAGGALASVGATKQRRIVYAAQHFLLRYKTLPPCRFDVVAIDGMLKASRSQPHPPPQYEPQLQPQPAALSEVEMTLSSSGKKPSLDSQSELGNAQPYSPTSSARRTSIAPTLTWVQGAFFAS